MWRLLTGSAAEVEWCHTYKKELISYVLSQCSEKGYNSKEYLAIGRSDKVTRQINADAALGGK